MEIRGWKSSKNEEEAGRNGVHFLFFHHTHNAVFSYLKMGHSSHNSAIKWGGSLFVGVLGR